VPMTPPPMMTTAASLAASIDLVVSLLIMTPYLGRVGLHQGRAGIAVPDILGQSAQRWRSR
jgi:hypothetical protein